MTTTQIEHLERYLVGTGMLDGFSPSLLAATARDIVELVNLHDPLREAVSEFLQCGNDPEDYAFAVNAVRDAYRETAS